MSVSEKNRYYDTGAGKYFRKYYVNNKPHRGDGVRATSAMNRNFTQSAGDRIDCAKTFYFFYYVFFYRYYYYYYRTALSPPTTSAATATATTVKCHRPRAPARILMFVSLSRIVQIRLRHLDADPDYAGPPNGILVYITRQNDPSGEKLR